MTIPAKCDVVVAGGGPAGSLAATYLAQKGHNVVLLERETHPRPKVGESLIPHFWKYVDEAGATEAIKAANFVEKAGGVVAWNQELRAQSFKGFGFTRPAMHVERDIFDQILFENAADKGALTFENVKVTGVECSGHGESERAVVSYEHDGADATIECRYLLDATGQNAIVGRQLGTREMDEAFRFLSIWGYYEDSLYVANDGTVHPPADLAEVPPVTYVASLDDSGEAGWSWHIPLREKTSVGLVMSIKDVKTARHEGESWADFFNRRCLQVPGLDKMLANARLIPDSVSSIRDYSYQSTELTGPGYFLVGDAAAFVDPIFSVGVTFAMYSAAAAAWAADQCLTKPDRVDRVRSMYTNQLRGRLEVARSLALPRYRSTGEVSELAKDVVRLEPQPIKDLMYVVSELTTRTENWMEMVGGEPPEVTDEQMKVLDQLGAG